jgi:hypothetical protein
MPIRVGLAAVLALVCAAPRPSGAPAPIGTLALPIEAAALAAAAGLHRDDPSTLGIDIVRMAFASAKPTASEAAARQGVVRALSAAGPPAGRIPLPLSHESWRKHVLREDVPDDRLAAAIFGRRDAALVYHGLMGVDPATLAWIDANPPVIDAMANNPGVTAAFARSVRVRGGRIVTPGDDADALWAALVEADPRDPAAFARALISSRGGRTAAFYDAVAHTDSARQRFAIGRPSDPDRIGRARLFLQRASAEFPSWRPDDRPFLRSDVNAALMLRLVRVDASGRLAGPAARRVWGRLFGGRDSADGAVDAAWLAGAILGEGSGARARLETFLFAQRALADGEEADDALLPAIEGFRRFPALMLTLERHGVRAAASYGAAARAAAAVGGDDDALALFQSLVAIVDLAGRAETLTGDEVRSLFGSLASAATSEPARDALLGWFSKVLLPAIADAQARDGGVRLDGDAMLLQAIAGPRGGRRPAVAWEGQEYVADLAASEFRRLRRIRRAQDEDEVSQALRASSSRDVSPLARSLIAIVYASALGDPESAAATGGPVWRRHRFGPGAPSPRNEGVAWRLATEVFGPGGWHLLGSLLRLDIALAHLALRRIDATEMPLPSSLGTRDRRTLAIGVALIDRPAPADADLKAVAAAIARGRARAGALAADAALLEPMAADAGLSEWRTSAARWMLATEPARASSIFTTLELFRLGGGAAPSAFGSAAVPLDGCFCLRMPPTSAWEELAGRPSTGQLATEMADVMLRSAEALAARGLPAVLLRGVAAYAMQDVIDRARPAYFDDWLPIAFAARDLDDERLDDYVAALAAGGPLVPAPGTAAR